MFRKISKFIPAFASFLIGVGLQVSGIKIPWLGYGLMVLGGILLIIPAWPYLSKLKLQSPVVIDNKKTNETNHSLSIPGLPYKNGYEISSVHGYTITDKDKAILDKYERLINYDRSHLGDALIFTKSRCEFPRCNQVSGGVFIFEFDIFNGSIFQVEIGTKIEGILTATCGDFINKIELKNTEVIDHICSGMIVLQQPILPELCKDINQKSLRPEGYEVTFNFKDLKIHICESNSTVLSNLQLLKLPKTLRYNIKLHEIKSGESVFGQYELDLIQEIKS